MIYSISYLPEISVGWILAFLYFLSGNVNKLILGTCDIRIFFIKSSLINVARIIIFLSAIFYLFLIAHFKMGPFISAIFIAHSIFLFYDVFHIHTASLKGHAT